MSDEELNYIEVVASEGVALATPAVDDLHIRLIDEGGTVLLIDVSTAAVLVLRNTSFKTAVHVPLFI